jgi:hypothetical protein
MKTKLFAFSFLAITALATIFSGCKETEIPINFSYSGARAFFDVPVTNQTTYSTDAIIKFNVDSLAKVYKFDKKNLKYIKMKNFKLTIDDSNVNPYTYNLISDVFGYAIGNGMSDAKFVSKENIELNSATQVTMSVLDQDIKSFINSNQFRVRLDLALRDSIKHPFRLIGDLEYSIDAIGFEK